MLGNRTPPAALTPLSISLIHHWRASHASKRSYSRVGLLLVHFGAFLDDLESAARARMNDVFSFSFSAAAAAGREGALAKAS